MALEIVMELFAAAVLVGAVVFGLVKSFDRLGEWWDDHGGSGFGVVIAAIIGGGLMLVFFTAVRGAATRSP
jgi:hypothetical protein